MKKFKFTISGNQYEVEVQSFENDKAQVVVNGTQYEVDVEREKEEAKPVIAPRPSAPKAAAPAAAPAAGGNVDGVKTQTASGFDHSVVCPPERIAIVFEIQFFIRKP